MVFESSHCYIVHRPDFPTPNLFNSPDSFDPTLLSWRSTTQRRNQNICQFDLFCILSLSPSKHISLKTKQHLSLRLWLWFCIVLSPRVMRHDVHLEQLALLGLTTLLEVYSVVLWLFFITFENKEMIHLFNTSLQCYKTLFPESTTEVLRTFQRLQDDKKKMEKRIR